MRTLAMLYLVFVGVFAAWGVQFMVGKERPPTTRAVADVCVLLNGAVALAGLFLWAT